MRFALITAIVITILSVQLVNAYENTEYGFSINFPSGWKQTENPGVVALYTNDDASASVNIIIEETNLSLADYITESKDQLKNLDYYELISEDSRTISGLNGHELVFDWTYFPEDGNYQDLRDKQVTFVHNGKAFIITCSADYSDYDLFLPTFDQTLDSFRLTSSGTLDISNSTLIITAVVIVVVIALIISVVLLRRKRKLTQPQIDATGTGALYPPPPPPPP
jgi:hypothetical protein